VHLPQLYPVDAETVDSKPETDFSKIGTPMSAMARRAESAIWRRDHSDFGTFNPVFAD
jgi:hypothetical protein